MKALAIERVEVNKRQVEAVVRVLDPSFMRTGAFPGVAQRAGRILPGLRRHSCDNDKGHDALREFADTETPHLLEHVAAELMALAGSSRSLRGETVWNFGRDGVGVFHVRLRYDCDLVAVGALREAVRIVEWLVDPQVEEPDVDAAVGRLRAAYADAIDDDLGGV